LPGYFLAVVAQTPELAGDVVAVDVGPVQIFESVAVVEASAGDGPRLGVIVIDGGRLAVDQEEAPDSFVENGTAWEDLGSVFRITSGTLIVRLSNLADDFLIADGVRIEHVG